MKKELIIGFLAGIVIGIAIGIIIGITISKNNNSIKVNNNSTLNEYDQKFIGKWEYGEKYEEIENILSDRLQEYKEKYEVKSEQNVCGYYKDNMHFSVSGNTVKNITLIINEDGSAEYIDYYGMINEQCQVEIKTQTHYKGTFENSKIVFKESETNGEWKEIRQAHNIYLEDKDTLHYKVVDENPQSSTILFIKRN